MAALIEPPQFTCQVERDGPRALIVPRGELDLSTVDRFAERVDEALEGDATSVVVDLSGLTFADSSGLQFLLVLAERARRDRHDLELLPGPAHVMRLFELTATIEVLPFRSTA
jgi:anti-sigma B factor antagonist